MTAYARVRATPLADGEREDCRGLTEFRHDEPQDSDSPTPAMGLHGHHVRGLFRLGPSHRAGHSERHLVRCVTACGSG